MDENRLAENIRYYRREKGLSQEKVSEYMGVSRQAVTKWEKGISRPASGNLIRLAQLLEVSVDALLDNDSEEEKTSSTGAEKASMDPAKSLMGKEPWIFIGISALCMTAYLFHSVLQQNFSLGAFICMFILCVPIQMFLHIYFSHVICSDSFEGMAGFDDKVEYNIWEVKKMLTQIELCIGVTSTVFIFLLCAINSMDLKIEWLNGLLVMVYLLTFVATVEIINFKMADKIYCRDDDRKRAKCGMPVTVIYTLLLFAGMGMTGILFEIKKIENNTLPAIKTAGLLLLGILAATVGLLLEHRRIKQWEPAGGSYKAGMAGMTGFMICVILYGFMCIV
ncbi:MAG: helix-turn-helix domain-containing protein [Firmicutes bacterium]|nr:helix-turn-helix domain-containing protein [Bacillota bacterium]